MRMQAYRGTRTDRAYAWMRLMMAGVGLTLPLTTQAGAVRVWSGAGSDNLASTAANWVGGTPPAAGDEIVLVAGSNKDMTWDLNLPVHSWTQTGYIGTVTIATTYGSAGLTNFVITSDCVISNGTWTHLPHPSAQATELYRLRVSVGGDFRLGPNAALDVSNNGYAMSKGPGSFASGEHGGAYGGTGRNKTKCYGSISAPTNPGSGGKASSGGGIIHLTVGGTLFLDGQMRANGEPTTYYSGSGGAVFITAGAIIGQSSGLIQANSGLLTNFHSPGGGGRIALVVTNAGADFANFQASCQAFGSQTGPASWSFQENRSGAGTIYLETPAHRPGCGDLIIKGTGFFATDGHYTPLDDRAAGTFDFASITITNGGFLSVGTDDTLILTNTVLRADPSSTRDGINIDGVGKLEVLPVFGITNLQVLLRASTGRIHPSSSLILGPGTELVSYAPLTLPGDLTLADGARLTCPVNPSGDTYKLDLTVGGDLTIAEGGKIDVAQKGYYRCTGPGCATGTDGASYGGRGGLHTEGGRTIDTTVSGYGSIYEPIDLGSGGRYNFAGGGAVRMTIAGTLAVDGRILANVPADHCWNSSGGSIWITAGRLEGGGEINANGGPVWHLEAAGGGGRVAVTLTDTVATFDDYSGVITAYGGWLGDDADNRGVNEYPRAGAGTVYLRAGGEAIDEGTLIIDNADDRAVRFTEINGAVTGRQFKNVIIRKGARLWLDDGEVIEVSGDFHNTGMLIASNGATVRFVGAPGSVSRISGTTTFCILECRAPGKILEFEAGPTNTIAAQGACVLQGTNGSPVVLRSTVGGSTWGIKADALAGQSIEAVAVTDSDAAAGAEIVAINSTGAVGNNLNWRFETAAANEVITWTGNASTVWGVSGNWDLDRPPLVSDTVIIPAGAARQPAMSGAAVTVRNLEIRSGAALSLNGSDLTVQEDLRVAGTLSATASEIVTLAGNADFSGATVLPAYSTFAMAGGTAQTNDLGGASFHNLLVGNNSGVVALLGGCTAAELVSEVASGVQQIAFEAGASFTLQRLLLTGDSAATNLLLRSTTPGSQWLLKVTGYREVSGVDVMDCDASSGGTVPADFSKNSGNTLNWDFSGAVAQWRGTSSSDFNTAANWLPAIVPDADDRIVIQAPTRQLTITVPTSLRNLSIGNGTVRFAAPVIIGDALNVLDKGIAILDYPCIVSNSLTVMSGGTLTHTANTDTERYKINLAVCGDATFDSGSLVDANGRGYAVNKGPGVKTSTADSGPCHGGRGDFNSTAYPSPVDYTGSCYGSICAPTNCGSGGSASPGGGAILMRVEGILAHDGVMRANGNWQHFNSGSGGSIFLKAGTLKGKGSLQADGGSVNNHSSGGGGRIALVLTQPNSDFSAYAGSAMAYGGRLASTGQVLAGAGTVYWQSCAEGPRHGLIVVANDVNHKGTERYTDLPALLLAPARETYYATVRVLGRGMVRILDDVRMGDLWIEPATTRLNLNTQTLTIRAHRHDLGLGTISNYGKLVWMADGTFLMLR